MKVDVLYDPIRKKYVPFTPEERVRQRVIRDMIGRLGYPKGWVAVEKEIAADRRVDILCYCRGKEGLAPLLLVECKAKAGSEQEARQQAIGYNAQIGAPFIALAHEEGVVLFWREGDGVASVPFLPDFQQLIDSFILCTAQNGVLDNAKAL